MKFAEEVGINGPGPFLPYIDCVCLRASRTVSECELLAHQLSLAGPETLSHVEMFKCLKLVAAERSPKMIDVTVGIQVVPEWEASLMHL